MRKPIFLLVASFLLTTACHSDTTPEINNGISPESIINSINKGKAVIIQGKIITGDLDFTKVRKSDIFSSSLSIVGIKNPVTFIDCIFMGKVTTNGQKDKMHFNTHFEGTLTFEACDFRSDADFENTTVDGNVNFTGAIFREKALFNNVTFKGRQAYFTAFSSEKLFSMQEARIEGTIDFFKAKTTGKFTFQSTDFGGLTRFSDMDCNGKCDFSLANFRNDVLFTYTNFGNEFRMSNVNIAGKLDLISVTFQSDAWMTNAMLYGKVNLTKTEARSNFDISGSSFMAGKPLTDQFVILSPGKLISMNTRYAELKDFVIE